MNKPTFSKDKVINRNIYSHKPFHSVLDIDIQPSSPPKSQ